MGGLGAGAGLRAQQRRGLTAAGGEFAGGLGLWAAGLGGPTAGRLGSGLAGDGRQDAQQIVELPDGAQAFVDYFEQAARLHPGRHTEFRRVLADGDLVAIHSHQTWATRQPAQWAVVDIFRFDGEGKIVEHWDVLQAVPDTSANSNTMF